MPGVDGVDLRFDTLAVTAGMLLFVDIVLLKHGKLGRSVLGRG